MRRPCHFERPVQNDRLLQSYGHTRLVSDGKGYPGREMGWKIGAIVVAVFIVLGANAAWANAAASGVTALSSASLIEPASQSRPYGLQSTFAGETQ